MNNTLKDMELIRKHSSKMSGVFSYTDLSNLFAESNPLALNRRIRRLEDGEILTRFIRGMYTARDFDFFVLSNRINPDSYISVTTALAESLLIGSVPARTLYSVKTGRNRTYRRGDLTLRYLGIAPYLFFGFDFRAGLKIATPEKALLDTLYYYQKGLKLSFNIFTDIDMSRIHKATVLEYANRCKNPRFVSFVRGYLSDGTG